MHIVIDARRIDSSTGHYVERLLDHLATLDTTNRYTVVVLEKERDYYTPKADNFTVVTTKADHYTFGEQLGFALLLYRLKPDFVHFSMPQQPLLWVGKRVTTIHDTTLIRFENIDMNKWVYRVRRGIFTLLMRNVIARSEKIIVPTHFVKNDLNKWTDKNYTKKFIVTHEAGDMIHSAPEPIASLKGKQYLLYVGNAFPYKNLWRIVEAYKKVAPEYPGLELAFAGKKEFFYEQIEQRLKQEGVSGVQLLGYISDGEKRWAMAHANAYVVASLSEGFNIPLHEAMHEKTPVIASDASCLPEVAGEGAIYFDPYDTDDLVGAIHAVLDSEKARTRLIEAGQRQIAKFSWEKMAKETLAVYQSIK